MSNMTNMSDTPPYTIAVNTPHKDAQGAWTLNGAAAILANLIVDYYAGKQVLQTIDLRQDTSPLVQGLRNDLANRNLIRSSMPVPSPLFYVARDDTFVQPGLASFYVLYQLARDIPLREEHTQILMPFLQQVAPSHEPSPTEQQSADLARQVEQSMDGIPQNARMAVTSVESGMPEFMGSMGTYADSSVMTTLQDQAQAKPITWDPKFDTELQSDGQKGQTSREEDMNEMIRAEKEARKESQLQGDDA